MILFFDAPLQSVPDFFAVFAQGKSEPNDHREQTNLQVACTYVPVKITVATFTGVSGTCSDVPSLGNSCDVKNPGNIKF